MTDNTNPTSTDGKKRTLFGQSEFPQIALDAALRVPRAIWEHYAGHPTKPLDVAVALSVSPSSSSWRTLTGAATAYGLTKGGYNADIIELTPLSRRILGPAEEGDDIRAMQEAVLKPRVVKAFLEKYNNNRLPDDNIIGNVLANLGVPRDRVQNAVRVLRDNARLVGFVREVGGNLYVDLTAINTRSSKTSSAKSSVPTMQEASREETTINNQEENEQGDITQEQVKLRHSPQPTLHIDIQIHISPEASPDQIDQIFASMATHLYKNT